MADRRDRFETQKDLWEMITRIVEERKRREIDPTLTVLRQCVLDAENDRRTDPQVKQRIQDMLDFLDLASNWYADLKQLPRPMLVRLMKLGSKVAALLGG